MFITYARVKKLTCRLVCYAKHCTKRNNKNLAFCRCVIIMQASFFMPGYLSNSSHIKKYLLHNQILKSRNVVISFLSINCPYIIKNTTRHILQCSKICFSQIESATKLAYKKIQKLLILGFEVIGQLPTRT